MTVICIVFVNMSCYNKRKTIKKPSKSDFLCSLFEKKAKNTAAFGFYHNYCLSTVSLCKKRNSCLMFFGQKCLKTAILFSNLSFKQNNDKTGTKLLVVFLDFRKFGIYSCTSFNEFCQGQIMVTTYNVMTIVTTTGFPLFH